jgi:RNA polymerase sigma factor (sigma-70 family)
MATGQRDGVLRHLRRVAFLRDADAMTDGQLLEHFLAQRDEAAFAALVRRHGPMVLGVCRRLLGHPQDAEDAFQATFLVLVRKAASIARREQVGNWLYGTACRAALEARAARRRVRERQVSAMPEPAAPAADDWEGLWPLLDQELSRLPDKYRAAVVLCDLEGRTRKDAARQLGIPEGTLSGRLTTARRRLARRLARHGFAISGSGLAAVLSPGTASARVPTSLAASTARAAAAASVVSAQVVALTEGVMKTMLMAKLRVGVLVLAAVALAATGTGLVAHQVVAAGGQPPSRAEGANPQPPDRDGPADDKAQLADAEMHVIGVSGAKEGDGGIVNVEVRPTAKPVVLVLTSSAAVDWHVKLADGARVQKVILSGSHPQEIQGLPAGVPVVNRSYRRDDASRKDGWFWAYQWNTPQWREMVRQLNDLTGLPVASFQGQERGESFVVDGSRGREFGQKELKPRAPAPKEPTPEELRAAAAGAALHVVGISGPDLRNPGQPVDVEVRATAKPVVLVLASYGEAVWHVKPAAGARIKAVIVGGYLPQEIDGLPADVPVRHFCPDTSSFYFGTSPVWDKESFYAYKWNTTEYRRMVDKLNDLTGLLVSTFQGAVTGTGLVVDGARGQEFAQKERKPRPTPPKEPTPQELWAAGAGAELHVVGMHQAAGGNGVPVDVDIYPTVKPVVLVLTSYSSVLWNVKLAEGARVKAVIIGGYFEQEFQGIPADVPVVVRDRSSPREDRGLYAFKWNTIGYRRMVEKLNALTGLLVSTFQPVETATASFVVDGVRGREHAQRERKPRPTFPKEPTPQELLALAAGAELHLVSVNPSIGLDGLPVDVEVRPTPRPVVLVLSSYDSVLWNLKVADGARVKAVILGGYSEQEIEGLPAGIPVVFRTYYPDNKRDFFYAFHSDTAEYRRMVDGLNAMTGLLVSTAQVENTGRSFVVDGMRGRDLAQKERKPRPAPPKEPTPEELRAACAGAELHVVSIYWPRPGSGSTRVTVDVRPTGKPVVLALAACMDALWDVKVADGARVKAVILGGGREPEFEGISADVPVVNRARSRSNEDRFSAYNPNSIEYRRMVETLNDLTGLPVATAQVVETGSSFVVDGTRGRELAQKELKPAGSKAPAKKQPEPKEDPLADVADVPSQDLRAAGDADQRYFLIGPKKDAKPPAEGHGLVVIMPGGDGSADFHPFVRRIYKNALSDRYLAAQPVAVKWTPDQQIVWPTKTNPVTGMKFGTEEFVEAVIEDVAKKHKLDRTRVFTLSWSSSGPAAYAASLQDKRSVTGSLVAMSVFNPKFLPPLKGANGHAYYLYHSPQDRVCPFRMAEQAKTSLAENGAKVRLETYEGGHGWRGDVYNDIRSGVEWLEKNPGKPTSGPPKPN